MVMPRSRSRSFESMTRSVNASFARKVPDWRSMASTRVVLPWSTWAMMAMLKIGFWASFAAGIFAGGVAVSEVAMVWSESWGLLTADWSCLDALGMMQEAKMRVIISLPHSQ